MLVPMDTILAVLATHTTAGDVWCERAGGCGSDDPVTLIASLGIGVVLLLGWLYDKTKGGPRRN